MKGSPMSPLEMLARLVAFPTVSATSNLELVDFVKTYLNDLGVQVQLVPNTAGDKASLFATVGPQVEGGVVLSGHSDVVPAGAGWNGDPFVMREEGSRLIGRGVC